MVEFRRETLAKFAFPLEGRDKEDRYDDINETAVLFRYCLPEKVSSFQSRLHVYFKNEADLLTFLGGLPDYFKERVIEIVYPPAGVTLRPGVLRFKKVKGFKYLIVSYWSRWTKQDAKLMLNIADTTDCTMGKSTQMRLMELLNDGTRDTAYLDHVRIRVPDEKTLSWIQLHSGRKWKIYEIEEIQ